ncbi:SET domain-containing protein 4-like [Patiria miniata]|uniref:Rubisco LSMT substrate-binding domain-containing protein n=1 Tax=Patiria miniata TaxID=46514 RepID=A0A913ZCS8_PATMI|nr:SET domain-containing protein 4-like [Patiria miniata]
MTSHQMLTVYLLFEACKGVGSFWFPYIAVLPQMFGTPPFFNERELQLLPKDTCTHAKAQIENVSSAFKELSAFFELLRGTYPSMSSRLSFERFRWAWFAVNTRCVYMKQENQQGNCALAPYIDLLNHSPEAETEAGFDSSLDCYVVKTETGCKKWQQAFICYGPHGNDKLLLEYGFVVPKSRNSSLQFEIDDVICCMDDVLETESGILLRRKHQILEESNLLCNLSCGWDGLSWHLEIAIKILCMDSKEIENWKRVYSSESVSSNCESKVKQLATRFLTTRLHEEQRVIQNILDTFPTAMGNKHLSMIHDLRQEKKNMLEFTLKRLIPEGLKLTVVKLC